MRRVRPAASLAAIAAIAAIAAALVVATPSARAQQSGGAGGPDDLYEITMSMEMEGMKMPGMKQTACTKKGAKDEERVPMEEGCRIVDTKRSGAKTVMKMVCEKGADRTTATMEMETLGKDAWRVKSDLQGVRDGEKFAMKSDVAGKRIGGCTAGEMERKFAAAQADAQSKIDAQIAKECDKGLDRLEAALFVPIEGAQLPPEALVCRGRKAEFCAKAAKVAGGVTSTDAWRSAQQQYGERWASAAKGCGTDPGIAMAPLCKAEVAKQNWSFVGEACRAEARALVGAKCAGRTYSTVAAADRDLCSALAGLSYTAVARSADKVPSAAPATPEPEKPKGAVDKLKEGADKLKKFLKF
jgi:hypothetical protein